MKQTYTFSFSLFFEKFKDLAVVFQVGVFVDVDGDAREANRAVT